RGQLVSRTGGPAAGHDRAAGPGGWVGHRAPPAAGACPPAAWRPRPGPARVLLLAAPLLAALVAAPHGRRPDDVEISATASATRCFEREEIELTVTAAVAGQMETISFMLELPPEFSLVTGSAAQVTLE